MLADMEKNHEGFSGSVHLVIGDADKGILQGIHGTVASLITVSPDYTVAVETALGAAIQNIVTENEAAAKNAIFYLKNKKAGRATFLPLSSIRGRTLAENTIHKTGGFLGIASNLIRYDAKYTEIVHFLLGRTVIVDTLDNGTELAKKNGYSFKIVTADGQVINPGGSLTGGSVAKSIGVLSRRNEIALLGKETDELKPVSYTHLDVYKRQPLSHTVTLSILIFLIASTWIRIRSSNLSVMSILTAALASPPAASTILAKPAACLERISSIPFACACIFA